MLRNGPNARAKSSTDDASWTCPAEGSEKIRERRQNCFRQPGHSPDTSGENHEYVAVLAERGRRRAPRFGGSPSALHQSTSLQDWITDARARSAALREFDGLCDRATTIAASVRAPNRMCARTSTSCRPINPAFIAAERACLISPNPYLASISRHLGQQEPPAHRRAIFSARSV